MLKTKNFYYVQSQPSWYVLIPLFFEDEIMKFYHEPIIAWEICSELYTGENEPVILTSPITIESIHRDDDSMILTPDGAVVYPGLVDYKNEDDALIAANELKLAKKNV
jgi:hypothetical protein